MKLFDLFKKKDDPRFGELFRRIGMLDTAKDSNQKQLALQASQLQAQAIGLAELREQLQSIAERVRKSELHASGQAECRVCTRPMPSTSLTGGLCHQCGAA